MQTQQINVHVKVQCDNDFRRFALAEVTYKYLVDTIRTLLGFAPTTVLKLSYLDDEDDWVLFGTDGELQYATTLSGSPLKISVEAQTSAEDSSPLTLLVPAKVTCAVSAEEKPWKWRSGREGRDGRCKRRGECKGERINAKVARLTDRHAVLTAKLIEGDLPQEKVRALEWRLSHLQNKIDSLKAKKEQQLRDACAVEHQEKAPVAKTENDETMDEELGETKDVTHCHRRGPWGRRHGHARWGGHLHFAGEGHPSFGHHLGGERHPHPFGHHFGGEGHTHPFRPHHRFGGELHPRHHRGGCHRREKGERKCGGKPAFLRVCTAPEGKAAFDRLHAAKVAVVTARREKASEEVIMVKIEELKEARAAWRELKMALWKEHKVQWENKHSGCPRKKLAQ